MAEETKEVTTLDALSIGMKLNEMGIHEKKKDEKGWYKYLGAWGSMANNKHFYMTEPRMMSRPDGSPVLAVHVEYKAESESGEDMCDYTCEETRNVPVAKLLEYLAGKGIK